MLADEVASIESSWRVNVQQRIAELKQVAQATHESETSPEFIKRLNSASDEADWAAVLKYRQYSPDVDAMRKVLRDRTGDHDPDKDGAYDMARAGRGNPLIYPEIAADLRKLAGEVLAMRQ